MRAVPPGPGRGDAVIDAPQTPEGWEPRPSTVGVRLWRRQLWLIYLGFGVLVILVYLAVPSGLGADAIYVAAGLATVAAIVGGMRLHRPPRPGPWWVMAAGQLLWVVADAVGNWEADGLGLERFPGPADGFYLLGYPVLGVGLFLLARGRRPRRDVGGALDSLIVTVALTLLSWVLLARPTLNQYDRLSAAAAVAVGYPLGDILLVGMLVALLSTPGARTPALRLLLVALALLIAADVGAAALGVMTFASSAPINPVWLASYVVWGAAALHPSMRELSTPTVEVDPPFTRARLAALAVAVLVAPGTLAVELAAKSRLDAWAVVLCSVVLFSLVVARMKFAIDQISTANREREQAQSDLAHQAAHDSLTGLVNRAQAMRLITGALSRAQRSGAIVGLLFVDLDGFKGVNDTLGHAAGDQVLMAVARRMEAAVRGGDLVARLGGDEFLVLLEPLIEEASAIVVADRLIAEVSAPITLRDGQQVQVGASIGAALSQDGQIDADALIHDADVAVYRAKAAGRGRTELADQSARADAPQPSGTEAGRQPAMLTG
jgi:diguanylate cyclase (GGDEF)-like protein